MAQRSNIGASLNRKRHVSLLKKAFVYFIFILFFISLAILGLTTDQVRIKNLVISGNSTVPTSDVKKIINDEMNIYYLLIIPTNNLLLLRRGEIESDILNKIKKINSVKISIHGIDKIEITVSERNPESVWCAGAPVAKPASCYFMDSDGFVFEPTKVASSTLPEYFGLISFENPIGQNYLKDDFKRVSGLYATLNKMSFLPQYLNAIDVHNYEIYVLGGGKIIINDEKSFETSLTNLQALVSSNYIKTDSVSLQKIKYIDLRFGNKVPFELNK